MRRFRLFAAAGALALALVLAACGESDDEDEPQGAQVTTEQPAASPSGDGGQKTQGGGAGGAAPDSGPALTGDPEEARAGAESIGDVYEGFAAAVENGISSAQVPARETLDNARDNEALSNVCDLMSEEAQQQTIVYAKRSAGLAGVEWNCENATGLLLRRAGQTGGLKKSLRAEVVGVNVDGDRATASIRFGGKGAISTIPLVKEDGEWKLAASPSGGGGK